ncbi:MAG: UDP-N-acetylmuramoyl-L-alanyl-D-glutamate--2,6-diaminopimelate ligase [Desulfobacteraceae bacterium]|nr:UDP-N-acetylmuramoyl-L-alanyl-D-glutamate--2,6-diaminopimelate ligase [Desulfobacteraceae bacterium]
MAKLLADILRGITHTPEPLADGLRIEAITADSRTVKPGSLFVCLQGLAADGHDFASQAAAKGATALVVNRSRMATLDLGGRDIPMIGVDDTREALGRMACAFYGHPGRGLVMIGLTGTNGKTTTTFLLEAIIRAAGGAPGVIGTINCRYQGQEAAASFTTPEPLELQAQLARMRAAGVTHVVMEVSSHALALGRVSGLDFDAALFTNLTRDHLDFHRDMEDYYQAKRRLFTDHLRPGATAVIIDDGEQDGGWGRRLKAELRHLPGGPRVISCGFLASHEVSVQKPLLGLDSTSANIRVRGGIVLGPGNGETRLKNKKLPAKDRQFAIRSNLVGRFNLKNVLGAVGVAVGLGIAPAAIIRGLKRVIRVPGRLEPVAGGGKPGLPAVFVDYAHTPDALQHVLVTLRGLNPKRLLLVFGCGGDRDPGKRPLMGEIAGRLATVAIITADNSRSEATEGIMAAIEAGVVAAGMRPLAGPEETSGRGYLALPARGEAVAQAIALAGEGDIVLISGKGHETYQLLGGERLFFDDRQEAAKCLRAKARRSRRPPAARRPWSLARILAATGGGLAGEAAGRMIVGGIVTDSRRITPGDAFLALAGERFDGVAFAGEAQRRGARLMIAERRPASVPGLPVVVVPDSLKALGDLAAYRRRQMKGLTVVAITGSSGKTTVKEMTAAILGRQGETLKTQGNFNNLIGLPLSLLPVEPRHRFAVLEMGMNRPGEIARLAKIADPDAACINNVQPAHLAGLGSIEGVARAKGELFAGCRSTTTLAVNLEDPWVRRLAKGLPNPQIGFGFRAGAEVRATHVRPRGREGLAFTLHLGGAARRMQLKVIGRHNVLNALAAASLSLAAGAELEQIVAGLEAFRPGENRLGHRRLASGLLVINDSYNANPGSMTAALRSVAEIRGTGRLLAVLGDMLELGAASREAHRAIGQEAARLGFDFLLALGDQAPALVEAAWAAGMSREAALVCAGKAEAAARIEGLLAAGRLAPGDLVLIKGSRGMRMEEVLSSLEDQGARARLRSADSGGEK